MFQQLRRNWKKKTLTLKIECQLFFTSYSSQLNIILSQAQNDSKMPMTSLKPEYTETETRVSPCLHQSCLILWQSNRMQQLSHAHIRQGSTYFFNVNDLKFQIIKQQTNSIFKDKLKFKTNDHGFVGSLSLSTKMMIIKILYIKQSL